MVFLDEALSVAETMLQDSQDRVGVLKKLLLQVNDAEDTRHLIQSLLEDNRTDMMRLKRDMGAALRPILGQPNGYYVLDLNKEIDR
ncbi:hypothetical protein EON65_33645 [archaeon]|nr:MAG: hypothetical protein EON65_33645 [archaeon]